MTPKEKAQFLVNEQYYQPLTLHLNLNNNSREMWEYAKRCALICVEEIIGDASQVVSHIGRNQMNDLEFWLAVKIEIKSL